MPLQLTKEQVKVAAEWWAKKLIACKQSGLSEAERRDPATRSYQLAEMLMTLSKPSVTMEQIEAFQSRLEGIIEGWQSDYLCLSVDYGPCLELAECLTAAGIPNTTGTLPIKTRMWFGGTTEGVSVSYGYGAPEERIA